MQGEGFVKAHTEVEVAGIRAGLLTERSVDVIAFTTPDQ